MLAFFAAVQRKFYVEGSNPKETGFYRQACLLNDLDFALFSREFSSSAAKEAVSGVHVLFPTLLLENHGEMTLLSTGYTIAKPVIV